jgi:predicted nucleic acid-binding protein
VTYAFDTNTISYLLQKDTTIEQRLNAALKNGYDIVIPPIAYYEIRRGFKHKAAPGKEAAFSLMCKAFFIGEMSTSAWDAAADIYAASKKAGKSIEDTDILIAAFCIANGYTLVTNNSRHFADINGLAWENWAE